MMKKMIIAVGLGIGLTLMSAQHGVAGGIQTALEHSGKAVKHSALATSYTFLSGAQVVAGAVALPLQLSGAAGEVSGQIGNELWDGATQPIGAPLDITEETLTVGPPPNSVLQKAGPNQHDSI